MKVPRVQIKVLEVNGRHLVETILGGNYIGPPIAASSEEEGKQMIPVVRDLVQSVYQKAYNDGKADCQNTLRDALGCK